MASNPPGPCCTKASLHEGEPTGKSIQIGSSKIEAYLATPKEEQGHADTAILYLPDIYGIWQNSKLMADAFAAHGYATLIPDLFQGDQVSVPMPSDFDIMGWFSNGSDGKTPHNPEAVDPIVVEGIKALRAMGYKKIGAVGYCFGAKYLVRHYKDGIEVGYVAHPSFVTEEELAAISGPLSIAAAEVDSIFPAEKRHQSEEILEKTGKPYQINLFSGVEHGFAVRADLSKGTRSVLFAKEQAFAQAIAWFNEFLLKEQAH